MSSNFNHYILTWIHLKLLIWGFLNFIDICPPFEESGKVETCNKDRHNFLPYGKIIIYSGISDFNKIARLKITFGLTIILNPVCSAWAIIDSNDFNGT